MTAAGSSADDSNLCLFDRRGGGGGMRMESITSVITSIATASFSFSGKRHWSVPGAEKSWSRHSVRL